MGDILVIDDNALVLEVMRDLFELAGYRVHSTGGWSGIPGILASHEIAVVLLDLGLPGRSPEDLVAALGSPGRKRPRVILYSGQGEHELRATSQRLGTHGWLCKGSPIDSILEAVHAAGTAYTAEILPP